MEYLSQTGMAEVFRQWAVADPNINQYGFGQFYKENGEAKVNQVYPGVWVNPTSTGFLSDYAITRQYQILIYDLVFLDANGNSNQNAVVSDCEEIAFRLVRFLKEKSDVFNVNGSPTITPLSDRWLDAVSGVLIDITIEFNAQSSDCDDPAYTFNIKTNNI